MPAVSVVTPVFNEATNIAPLVEAVRSALGPGAGWELLLVDDGSTDGTAAAIREAARADGRIRLVSLARNYGQSTALQAGFDRVRGQAVVTLDGDLQNDPADIPLLLGKLDEGYDLVAGYRIDRQDTWLSRRVPSAIANRIIRGITRVPIRDNGCSLKAYRRELVDRLVLYSDLHRFIPAVAVGTAGARVVEVGVRHHPRRHGRSKYGLGRVWRVLADLLTLMMIRSFRERPLALFGTAALGAAGLGLLFAIASVVDGLLHDGRLVFPGVMLVWFGLAGYLVMLGLLTETALRRARSARPEMAPLARRD